jgi:hypothetical protein
MGQVDSTCTCVQPPTAMRVLREARHALAVVHAVRRGRVEVRAVAIPRRLHLLIACVCV